MRYFRSILVTILLVTSLYSTLGTVSDPIIDQDSGKKLRGMVVPRINGIIQTKSNDDYLSEWEDAESEDVAFAQEGGFSSITGNLKKKYIFGRMYYAFSIPQELESVSIIQDMDDDETISEGDIKFQVRLDGLNSKNKLRFASSYRLTVYDGFKFVDANQYFHVWNEVWRTPEGWDSYQRFVNRVGDAKFSLRTGSGNLEVEMQLNLKFLRNWVSTNGETFLSLSETGISNTTFYGIVLEDQDNQFFGYPLQPARDSNGEAFLSAFVSNDLPSEAESLITFPFTADLGIDEIELTQAVQTDRNHLSLVKDKPTTARVYVRNDYFEPVDAVVILHAYVSTANGLTHIGQMRSYQSVPLAYDRKDGLSTVNFDLPISWVSRPSIMLSAQVITPNLTDVNPEDNFFRKYFLFLATKSLNVYYVNLNFGDLDNPNMTSEADIEGMKTYTNLLLPTKVNFFEVDSTTVGLNIPKNSTEIKQILNEFFPILTLSVLVNNIANPYKPLPFPDQLFGIAAIKDGSTTGSSDPEWIGGDGVVSWGSVLSQKKGIVMAHELTHNLGDNSYGRHVGNPPGSSEQWGCGVVGPDFNWPKTNDHINQIHSTTIGWLASKSNNPVIPSAKPDFMSYCEGPNIPNWISDYRWERLFTLFRTKWIDSIRDGLTSTFGGMDLDDIVLSLEEGKTRVITGSIDVNGKAILNPSYEIPGRFKKFDRKEGEGNSTHKIQLRLSNNTVLNTPLWGPEGEDDPRHGIKLKSFFTFWVPDDLDVIGIRIRNSTNHIVAQKQGTGFNATGSLTYPLQIQRDQDFTVSWSLNMDNTTKVTSILFYTHDGVSWQRISPRLTGTDFTTQLSKLPGSDQIKFRLIVTDGFDSHIIEGDQVSSLPKLPIRARVVVPNIFDGGRFTSPVSYNVTLGELFSIGSQAFDPQSGRVSNESRYWRLRDSSDNVVETQIGESFNSIIDVAGDYTLQLGIKVGSTIVTKDSIKISVTDETSLVPRSDYNQYLINIQEGQTSSVSSSRSTTRTSEDSNLLDLPVIALPVLISIGGTVAFRRYRSSSKNE